MDNETGAGRPGATTRPLEVAVGHHDRGGEVVVTLRDAEVRHALGDLRWRLDTLLADGPATLVIDLAGVTQISSTMVAVLLRVKHRCLARGVDVVLREPSRRSVDLLHRTGLLGALAIEPVDESRRQRRGATSMRPGASR